eukprot:Seg774.1_Seg774.3 transcript_id=Seg774.1_Seg774.3/GoldUCD/mRNA.D3Y31 product=Calnexin protein_id=Seg774.1_Seg774.3/GoldUCD/D3Y31
MSAILRTFILGLAISTVCILAEKDKATSKPEDEVLTYKRPEVQGFAFIAEPFHSNKEFNEQWIVSQAKKDGVEAAISKYDGKWSIEEPKDNAIKGDLALVLKEKAKHHAISTMLPTKYDFTDQPFIVQYEVKFQNALECGGAYMKLLSDLPKLDLEEVTDKSQYTIMFGPDKCGEDSKLHFIFQHKHPKTGKFEEKHSKKPTGDFSKVFDDKKTHLFTLIVRPDNTFEIRVDKQVVNSGSLLSDFEPAVNPSKEIDDPNDKKPEGWDDREKIVDPAAKKPDDWDEDAPQKIVDPSAKKPAAWLDDAPETVPDPSAVKPADWDDEEDGDWEPPQIPNPKCAEGGCGEWKAPMIDNPKYKGKWSAPLINNPAYKGIWSPKKIENPDYFEDNEPFKMTSIAAIGFELWSMTDDIVFDNIIIANQQSVVDQWTADTWDLKFAKEFSVGSESSSGIWNTLQDAAKERQWLWAVYVVVIFLPIILILACCLPSKKDAAAERKKTDEATADDEPIAEQEVEAEEQTKEEDAQGKAEGETEAAAEGEAKEASSEEATSEEATKEAEEPEAEQEEDIPPPDASPRTRAARRRARKE